MGVFVNFTALPRLSISIDGPLQTHADSENVFLIFVKHSQPGERTVSYIFKLKCFSMLFEDKGTQKPHITCEK